MIILMYFENDAGRFKAGLPPRDPELLAQKMSYTPRVSLGLLASMLVGLATLNTPVQQRDSLKVIHKPEPTTLNKEGYQPIPKKMSPQETRPLSPEPKPLKTEPLPEPKAPNLENLELI